MKLLLISPEGLHYEQEVNGFVYNSRTGQKTVLADQIETLSFFECTELSILAGENSEIFYIALGYVLVKEGESKIVAKIVSKEEAEIDERYQQLMNKDIRGDAL
ncbi:F0F1 ATP synthase subunit epsilon [Erwinia sp. CPCC 100877]|nr:F0F1 ATP synthase subunit epsilon [Erwinia sp. CPCC 100877]